MRGGNGKENKRKENKIKERKGNKRRHAERSWKGKETNVVGLRMRYEYNAIALFVGKDEQREKQTTFLSATCGKTRATSANRVASTKAWKMAQPVWRASPPPPAIVHRQSVGPSLGLSSSHQIFVKPNRGVRASSKAHTLKVVFSVDGRILVFIDSYSQIVPVFPQLLRKILTGLRMERTKDTRAQ
ncbi:hypothetical protein V9T40_004787 [Parthenolecanium corni]|uniref:Uncharacterized protein n=1 Tax=Parthenolecanium corni TaxID=536013 RepID=A0AAN9TEQ5_9HEMI